ncbi:membrane-targeted effector domain-containing toxin [Pseudomonas sp. CDFA 602]|uniref:membrane-targeted effector domain-containing toxin n=1 Tax=Pseudomonas californiensis TaxID=2829823 RepID=UPI001E461B1E|nr:membrane-targeted effector domain-containing toxin [Pseudomonas californiensis]MCD5993863.1 membrane-targeted effector domain-containing toxin [Pseudomonas californiensis]MCD5999634.1 membrane-targeted effector domain-containing toxin [Pseudomonas californiensis]
MNIAGQTSENDESKGELRSRRDTRVGGQRRATDSSSVASSSRAPRGHSGDGFKAANLAELARWTENKHTHRYDPRLASGVSMPSSVIASMLDREMKAIKAGIGFADLKPEDVGLLQSRNHIDVNLNYLEMREWAKRRPWGPLDENKVEANLIRRADRYFDDFKSQDRPALGPVPKLKSKDSLGVMRELLNDAPGLVIGEAHSSVASKRELTKNMKDLKAAGVTTLFMEHLCSDSHGQALDEYMNSPKGSPMPPRLKAYLDMQTRGNLPPNRPMPSYTFATVVESAKKAGIQVIPLDTAQTYDTSRDEDGNSRIKAMNYYGSEKIRLTQPPGKWLAFVGSGHATDYQNVPGLAELQGVRSLIIDDYGSKSRPQIDTNVKNYLEQINPDVTMSYQV